MLNSKARVILGVMTTNCTTVTAVEVIKFVLREIVFDQKKFLN